MVYGHMTPKANGEIFGFNDGRLAHMNFKEESLVIGQRLRCPFRLSVRGLVLSIDVTD